jgi:hypothetical protein
VCAIHQPNLFPRMATLAKIAAADVWIVLDTVQAARRDWQHRTRLAHLADPERRQWLSIETRRPKGRDTLIGDTTAADPAKAARRLAEMIAAAPTGPPSNTSAPAPSSPSKRPGRSPTPRPPPPLRCSTSSAGEAPSCAPAAFRPAPSGPTA